MLSIPPYSTSRSLPALVIGLAVLITGVIVSGGVFLASARGSDADRGTSVLRPAPVDRLAPDAALPSGPPAAVGGPGVPATPPSLLAVARASVPAGTLRTIARVRHVRKVAAADGGTVRVSGVALRLLAVDPAQFRAWTPKPVADHPQVWTALAGDALVADTATVKRLGMVLGARYQVDGGPRLRLAASASLGLPGIDGLVGEQLGRRLGFTAGVVVLIHGDLDRKDRKAVAKLLGPRTTVVPVREQQEQRRTTRAATPPTQAFVGRPASYLELYRRAAALCPGLSWTVLAAIGQVESGHGRNNGPSSAGALGPMQFMPGTWKAYGVDGDGDGVADIRSAYDAVPSAARYLCANGAGHGGQRLRQAVWRYNHSWAYVDRVLSLADAYARAYAG